MKEYAFGIDLGGTTAKIGLFKTTGELLDKWEVPTDTSNAGEHILKNLAAAVQGKMQEKGLAAEQVEGVGVGVPGLCWTAASCPSSVQTSAAGASIMWPKSLAVCWAASRFWWATMPTWPLWARSGWVPPRAAAARSWSRWHRRGRWCHRQRQGH